MESMELNSPPSRFPDSEFWKGKKVFLTGHTGFKGSWLSFWLLRLKSEVVGYSLAPETNPSLFGILKLEQKMRSIIADVRDQNSITSAISEAQPDIIIHMAAQPLVRKSYLEPIATYATNVMGTVHVLEAARTVGKAGAVLVVTSDKCYENREWIWGYREHDRIGGHDPYSSSKGCAEIVTNSYRSSYFGAAEIGLATARAGNVVGGGDWSEDRLIPDIFRALEKAEPPLIRNPQAVRPWQHALEPLSGYLCLIEELYKKRSQYSDSWNFGPRDEDAQTVASIADQLCEHWGDDARWTKDTSLSQHEANYLKLDVTKAWNELKWKPVLRLQTALRFVVEWHKSWIGGADMVKVTDKQISEYLES